jgi:hypothetical protein
MGTRRTDLDIARDEKALEINAGLVGTGIEVTAGGRWGPYAVTVDRLNEKEMRLVVRMLRNFTDAMRQEG